MTSDDIIGFLKRARAGGYVDPRLDITLHDGERLCLRFEGMKAEKVHGHARYVHLTEVGTARFDILEKELDLIEESLKLRAPLGLVPEDPR
jgi:hypothetical protein